MTHRIGFRKWILAVALLLAAVALAFGLIGVRDGRDAGSSTGHSTSLYLNWIFTGTFAGEVLGANEEAHKHGIKISLVEGGEGRDPLKLVRDGMFGTASAEDIVLANDKGGDFVIVGVINDEHPGAFVSLRGSNISTPKDFEGRRVGLLPFGATGLIYEALLQAQSVDQSKIKEVVVSPDLRPFLSGRVNDVQPIFLYDETITLDELGIEYNVIDPRQFGVFFKGQAYFTTRSTVEHQPELVRRFVAAMSDGWNRAAEDPEHAIAALKAVSPTVDSERELALLKRGLPFFVEPEKRKTLSTDPDSWGAMLDFLHRQGMIRSVPPVDHFMNMSFVQGLQGST